MYKKVDFKSINLKKKHKSLKGASSWLDKKNSYILYVFSNIKKKKHKCKVRKSTKLCGLKSCNLLFVLKKLNKYMHIEL